MSVKTFNGRAIASMKTFNGRAAANVKTILGVTVPAASSYLVSQDCEGGGIPTNTQPAGSLPSGWTNGGGVWNYSAAPLQGVYSWRQPFNSGTVRSTITPTGAPFDEIWIYALLNITASATTAGRPIIGFDTSTSTGVGLFCGTSGANNRIYCGTVNTTVTLVTGTTYSIWLHFLKAGGTAGADLLEIFISTDTTKPGSPTASILTGNRGTGVTDFRLGRSVTNGGVYIIDNIRVSTSAIGSNPS